MELYEEEDTVARMFIGLEIPERAQEVITKRLGFYPQYVERRIPTERWHMTLFFLGDVVNPQQYMGRLKKSLPQAFVPTISVTHLGRGLRRDQLWAYVNPTPALLELRGEIEHRLKSMRFPIPDSEKQRDFVPHISVARLYPMTRGIGVADEPATVTFTAKQAHIYQTHNAGGGVSYTIEESIPLMPDDA